MNHSLTEDVHDVIVIGAGVIGSSTAYWLSKDNVDTLVIEQYNNPNPLGSSHGHVRIVQVAYDSAFDYYEEYVPESLRLWHQLEQESGTTIFRKCGFLTICSDENHYDKMKEAVVTSDLKYTTYENSRDIEEGFPMFSIEEEAMAVYEHGAGTLHPDTATKAYQTMAKKQGARFHYSERVQQVIPGEIITVITDRGHYRCNNLVLTVGPWAPSFCKQLELNLPIKPTRVSIMYWQKKDPDDKRFQNVPGFTFPRAVEGKYHIYGAPLSDFPNLVKIFNDLHFVKMLIVQKWASTFAGREVTVHNGPVFDPEDADTVTNEWSINAVSGVIRNNIPGLHDSPQYVHRCIYSKTPDENYIIDRHPEHNNIIIGAGFSGHGFNTSPVTGRQLSDLAQGKTPKEDISCFKLDRFDKEDNCT